MAEELGIYLGKEIEGKDLGEQTLFIPRGSVASLGVLKVHDKIKQLGCLRIYFGAKERRGLDIEDLTLINLLLKEKRYGKKYQILAEVTDFEWCFRADPYLISHIEIIFVVKVPNTETSVTVQHIKIEDKFDVHWYKCPLPVITDLNNPEYEKDVKVII